MSLAKVRSHRGIERDRSERSYYPSALTVLEEKQIEQMVTLENLEKETSELELRLNDTLFELASESTLQFAFQYKGWYQPTTQDWNEERKKKVSDIYLSMREYQKARQDWARSLVERMRERKQPTEGKERVRRINFEASKLAHYLKEERLNGAEPEVASPEGEIVNEWGDFELGEDEVITLEKIGSGAFGDVFKGICRQKVVAVKTLKNIDYDPAIFESLKREIMIMQANSHQNILLFMGACMVPGHYCLVTELAENGSLDHILHKLGAPILFVRKMRMAEQVAAGLNWLHLQTPPLLHLDIKPANLLVMADWTVKIADFGMSRFRTDLNAENTSHDVGSIGGTPLYMPPEMYDIKPIPTEKCDVFAFAIVLWEILTQQHPFAEFKYTGLPNLIAGVCTGVRPTIPEETPTSLRSALEKGWSANPNDRPSFQEMMNAKIFDNIVAEAVSGGEQLVVKLMQDLKISTDVEKISWENFKSVYCSIFGHNPAQPDIKCMLDNLKSYLNVNGDNLETAALIRFTQWWKPLKGQAVAKGNTSTLEDVYNAMKELWFWGDHVNKESVYTLLCRQKAGTYLVRCGSQPGRFVVNFVTKKKGKGTLVEGIELFPHASGLSLVELVKTLVKQARLKIIMPGRSLVYQEKPVTYLGSY